MFIKVNDVSVVEVIMVNVSEISVISFWLNMFVMVFVSKVISI